MASAQTLHFQALNHGGIPMQLPHKYVVENEVKSADIRRTAPPLKDHTGG